MTFYKWPDIEGFHNVRKATQKYPELCGPSPVVTYQSKVKLHGTNAAVQCHADGTVVAQSRSGVITPENDNMGFARWVAENAEHWGNRSGLVFFGEWCGPGIQKGVAISQVPAKTFAVFAAMSIPDEALLITEPNDLIHFVPQIPNVHVLPWSGVTVQIDWTWSTEELQAKADHINEHVEKIEACDPWVKAIFGVEGTGEGLVFYPTSSHKGRTNFSNLSFKAKGEAHRVVKQPKAATVDPQVAQSIDDFVSLVLTEARLEQGAGVVNGDSGEFDKRRTGDFVRWILADLVKETQDELEAAGLTMAQVQKSLSSRASRWYITKA